MFKGYLTLNINQVSHFDPQCTSNFTTQSENLHYVITRQERHSEEIFRKETIQDKIFTRSPRNQTQLTRSCELAQ